MTEIWLIFLNYFNIRKMLSAIFSVPLIFIRSVFNIISSPKLIMWCLIPYLIGILSFCTLVYFSYDFREEAAAYLLPSFLTAYSWIFSWLILLFNFFISGILSLITILVLGGFFIENFIEEALRIKGVRTDSENRLKAYLVSTIRAAKDSIIKLMLLALISILTFMLGFIPPLAAVVLLIGAFLVGYELFDLPLCLLNINFKERIKLIKLHKAETFILGIFFSFLMLIPFGAVIFLPVAYFSAVDLLSKWELKLHQRLEPTK